MTATIRNRVTEKDLREWLDQAGFAGQFANIEELELHAIERPGWIQVFRFEVNVRENQVDAESERPWLNRWGVILDDERKRREPTKVWLYDNREQQLAQLCELSAGRLVLKHGRTSEGFMTLAFAGAAVLATALIVKWLFPEL